MNFTVVFEDDFTHGKFAEVDRQTDVSYDTALRYKCDEAMNNIPDSACISVYDDEGIEYQLSDDLGTLKPMGYYCDVCGHNYYTEEPCAYH